MKKLVLVGVFVFGVCLLEANAMNTSNEEVSEGTSSAVSFVSREQFVSTTNTELKVGDIDWKDFVKEFEKLMTECVSSIYGEKAMEDTKFQLLAKVLDDKHKSQMRTVMMLAQSDKGRQLDAHNREMEAKDAQLEEARNEKIRLEKENELQILIGRVFISNPDNEFIRSHSFITGNIQEIKYIKDLFDRRSRVEAIYNKVKLFSGLFGREDLGVEATESDLEAVRLWLDRTKEDVVLAKYGEFSIPSNDRVHRAFNGEPFGRLSEGREWPRYRRGPDGQVNSFNGSDIGRPLLNAKERLEGQIDSLSGADKDVVLALLASIFQKSEADDVVRVTWTHPYRPGEHSFAADAVSYYKNGQGLGYWFREYIGTHLGESNGIFGDIPLMHYFSSSNLGWAWNNKSKNIFQEHLDKTVDAIKTRAGLLFDFETNPESPLQRLYKESGQTNPPVINFPAAEIDALVKQCNDFIKKAI